MIGLQFKKSFTLELPLAQILAEDSNLWLARRRLLMHGAVISPSLTAEVTHILVDNTNNDIEMDSLKVSQVNKL